MTVDRPYGVDARRRLLGVRMSWHDLLFAHWPVDAAALRRFIPPPLRLDTFEGDAWLGVVPFRMTRVGPTFLPPLPGFSSFPELNVRTYVVHGDRPGVWFFSLDAAHPPSVRLARRFFHLPYFDARMRCVERDGEIRYSSFRTHRGAPPARLAARYRPCGPSATSPPGSLEHWLTERYALYSADARGRVYRGDVDHPPWPLQPGEVELETCDMTRLIGLGLDGPPRHVRFARRVDVIAAPIVPVGQGPAA